MKLAIFMVSFVLMASSEGRPREIDTPDEGLAYFTNKLNSIQGALMDSIKAGKDLELMETSLQNIVDASSYFFRTESATEYAVEAEDAYENAWINDGITFINGRTSINDEDDDDDDDDEDFDGDGLTDDESMDDVCLKYNGILNSKNNVCCNEKCPKCGGTGCANYSDDSGKKLGTGQCCSRRISNGKKTCGSDGNKKAPCKLQ